MNRVTEQLGALPMVLFQAFWAIVLRTIMGGNDEFEKGQEEEKEKEEEEESEEEKDQVRRLKGEYFLFFLVCYHLNLHRKIQSCF